MLKALFWLWTLGNLLFGLFTMMMVEFGYDTGAGPDEVFGYCNNKATYNGTGALYVLLFLSTVFGVIAALFYKGRRRLALFVMLLPFLSALALDRSYASLYPACSQDVGDN